MGGLLLVSTFERMHRISEDLGIHGVEVDAKDERAKEFDKAYGLEGFPDDGLHRYISTKIIKKAFVSA